MEELFYSSVHTGASAWFGIAGIAGTAALILFFAVWLMWRTPSELEALLGEEPPPIKRYFLVGGIVSAVVCAGGFLGYAFAPLEAKFDPERVSPYVEDAYGQGLDYSFGSLFGDRSEECLLDDECEGFPITHRGTKYWVKFDEMANEGYLVDAGSGEHVTPDVLTVDSLEKVVLEESRLTDVEVTVGEEFPVWDVELVSPQESPVTVSGVVDGVYYSDLILVADAELTNIRIVPPGENSGSVSEDDLMK